VNGGHWQENPKKTVVPRAKEPSTFLTVGGNKTFYLVVDLIK